MQVRFSTPKKEQVVLNVKFQENFVVLSTAIFHKLERAIGL